MHRAFNQAHTDKGLWGCQTPVAKNSVGMSTNFSTSGPGFKNLKSKWGGGVSLQDKHMCTFFYIT